MPTFKIENSLNGLTVGIDEVGRGPWAGPVLAAAVLLDSKNITEELLRLIDDSKKLSVEKREVASQKLIESGSVFFAIGEASVEEIDELNILQATMLAMTRAFDTLNSKIVSQKFQDHIQHALIDGNRSPKLTCQTHTIIKGDSHSYSIAAASIIAKVTRDQLMATLAKEYPYYGWEHNAGYGTKIHQDGLAQYGITPYHRKSYKPIQAFLLKK